MDRKGALTGGFHDVRLSRLEAIKAVKTWKKKYEAEEKRAVETKKEMVLLDQEITTIMSKQQLLEAKRKQLQDRRDPLQFEMTSKTKEEATLKESLAGKVGGFH